MAGQSAKSLVGLACLFGSALAGAQDGCIQRSVKFVVLNGDAELATLEDDVVTDLAAIGITATTEMLEKDDLNAAMTSGDFNL